VSTSACRIVGGCCGTTPEHLAAVVEACADLRPARAAALPPSVTSLYAPVPIEQDTSFLIIGERLNANGSKKFRELLLAEDWEAITQMAREQVREGAHTLDVCVDYVGRDGTADMVEVVDRLATQSTLPLVIDSTELSVVQAALRRIGGRAVINSVNLEDGRRKADVLFPLAKQFGAALVALAIDEEGQARTATGRSTCASGSPRSPSTSTGCPLRPHLRHADVPPRLGPGGSARRCDGDPRGDPSASRTRCRAATPS
jgi:5-methyltetrahydrofolate--homocysteine methyltransferase